MNWDFIMEYLPMYERAAILTVKLGLIGIAFAVLVGLICAMIQYHKIPVARQIVAVYIELSRNTPLLVQLFFIYYGLPKLGLQFGPELCGIIGLAFLGGSYMAEAFRSGIENVSVVQHESALSLGMTKSQVFWHIILPQAFETSVPVLCANIIFLIKETSVFSAVALADLMFVAKDLIGIYYKTDEALFMLVIAYLIILLPISLICTFIERRVRYAGFGDSSAI